MAAPKNIRVEYSVEATINTGNFQNVKPGYRVSADVGESTTDEVRRVRKVLKTLVDGWLEEDIKEHRDDAGE